MRQFVELRPSNLLQNVDNNCDNNRIVPYIFHFEKDNNFDERKGKFKSFAILALRRKCNKISVCEETDVLLKMCHFSSFGFHALLFTHKDSFSSNPSIYFSERETLKTV